jgi:DNA repair protein REV1
MITKLETGAPKGQAMLSFAPLDKGRTDVETDDTEERSGEHSREVTRMPSPVREPHPTASSDHIDPDFLAALPPDLRREVEADHTARRAAKHRRTGPEEVEIPPADKPPVNKSKSKLNAAAHITRQLRPKLKTQLNAKAIAELPLYGAWSRAGSRPRSESVDPGEPIDIGSDSDVEIIEEAAIGGFPPSELRALGIDLDVFAALPEDLQADVVAQERARVQPRLAQSRARPRVSASLSPAAARARNSRSNSAVPPGAPMVYANAVTRPALFRARDTDDVGDVLARWIASAPAPAARDVSRVSGYMVKCVTCGIGGVDHVSVLLRSMSGLLRDRKEAAGEWWGAFDEVKRAVDDVLVQRLGAPLRL